MRDNVFRLKSFSKEYPTHVNLPKGVAGLKSDSTVLLSQVRTIDKTRLEEKIGFLAGDYLINKNMKSGVLFLVLGSFFFLGLGEQPLDQKREAMVKEQLELRDIRDPRVLQAMRKVKRHLFVPPSMVPFAYDDGPLPIGHEQTISQPYIVAYMTEALRLKPQDRVLEIGTGSGYQAAVLAELVTEVYSIEIIPELAAEAKARLAKLGYSNVQVKQGDGYQGWPEHQPFDAILVTAAPETIPPQLVEQLKNPDGRMIVPVGAVEQELVLLRKTGGKIESEKLFAVRFVPMVEKNGQQAHQP